MVTHITEWCGCSFFWNFVILWLGLWATHMPPLIPHHLEECVAPSPGIKTRIQTSLQVTVFQMQFRLWAVYVQSRGVASHVPSSESPKMPNIICSFFLSHPSLAAMVELFPFHGVAREGYFWEWRSGSAGSLHRLLSSLHPWWVTSLWNC